MDAKGMVGRIYNRITIHCYKQNIKALGLAVSDKIVFMFFLFEKVQVGKDQEKAQSEKDSHSKNRGGKKPN